MPHPFVVAYIDPGTGSFLYQVLLAGILGFAARLAGWLRLRRNPPAPVAPDHRLRSQR